MARRITNKDIAFLDAIITLIFLLFIAVIIIALIAVVSPILFLIDKIKGTEYLKRFLKFMKRTLLQNRSSQLTKSQKHNGILRLENVKSGRDFEVFVANVLTELGYKTAITPESNDYGVDIVAKNDGNKYAIQCKYYTSTVGNDAVQQVVAGKLYYHCNSAIVITNSRFSKNAIELAKINKVLLWDGVHLSKLIKESNKGK